MKKSEIRCKICGKKINGKNYKEHFINEHSDVPDAVFIEAFYDTKNTLIGKSKTSTLTDFKKEVFKQIADLGLMKDRESFLKKFFSLIRNINRYFASVKTFRKLRKSDVRNMLENYFPFIEKIGGTVSGNNYERLIVMFGEKEAEQYMKILKRKNFFTGHGSEYAPFSRNSISNSKLTDEEYKDKLEQYNAKRRKVVSTTNIEYYMSMGYSKEEAVRLRKERQTTNSLKKLTEKYGYEKACQIIKERAEKRKATLFSNPESVEKWKRGLQNAVKKSIIKRTTADDVSSWNEKMFSEISQEFFDIIRMSLPGNLITSEDIFYARNNGEYLVSVNDGKNVRFLDFYIPKLNKCIEFDGEYWHSENLRDVIREDEIRKVIPGIEIMRVKEKEYKLDKSRWVGEALKFLLTDYVE
jgi:hypothetical protein